MADSRSFARAWLPSADCVAARVSAPLVSGVEARHTRRGPLPDGQRWFFPASYELCTPADSGKPVAAIFRDRFSFEPAAQLIPDIWSYSIQPLAAEILLRRSQDFGCALALLSQRESHNQSISLYLFTNNQSQQLL